MNDWDISTVARLVEQVAPGRNMCVVSPLTDGGDGHMTVVHQESDMRFIDEALAEAGFQLERIDGTRVMVRSGQPQPIS